MFHKSRVSSLLINLRAFIHRRHPHVIQDQSPKPQPNQWSDLSPAVSAPRGVPSTKWVQTVSCAPGLSPCEAAGRASRDPPGSIRGASVQRLWGFSSAQALRVRGLRRCIMSRASVSLACGSACQLRASGSRDCGGCGPRRALLLRLPGPGLRSRLRCSCGLGTDLRYAHTISML